MPLSVTYDNRGDRWIASGVARDPTVTALVGRRAYRRGPHVIGFDDSFTEPIVVRAFYDPTKETDPRAQNLLAAWDLVHVGYMQSAQIRFLGVPLPPDVYGGRLGDRAPYDYADHRFVDFMGPSEAWIRSIPAPFYPYNGMLVSGISSEDDLYHHPRPNGSLWSPRQLGTDQSMVASLVAEVAPSLVTPDDVRRMLIGNKLTWPLTPDPAVLAGREAYQVALDALRNSPPPNSPPDTPPFLSGLQNSDVVARLIGDYVMLGLPDPENLGDTLVITTAPGANNRTDVLVYTLSDYDMDDLTADAGQLALLRIRDWLLAEGINVAAGEPVRTYGLNGLLTSPFAFTPGNPPIELRYATFAVALLGDSPEATHAHHVLSGITWSVWLQYDEDTGEINMSRIGSPQTLRAFKLRPVLETYLAARNDAKGRSIDLSNFTRAAMLRDDFGAGDKPTLPDMTPADTI